MSTWIGKVKLPFLLENTRLVYYDILYRNYLTKSYYAISD